jgi:hypothetical protein
MRALGGVTGSGDRSGEGGSRARLQQRQQNSPRSRGTPKPASKVLCKTGDCTGRLRPPPSSTCWATTR